MMNFITSSLGFLKLGGFQCVDRPMGYWTVSLTFRPMIASIQELKKRDDELEIENVTLRRDFNAYKASPPLTVPFQASSLRQGWMMGPNPATRGPASLFRPRARHANQSAGTRPAPIGTPADRTPQPAVPPALFRPPSPEIRDTPPFQYP